MRKLHYLLLLCVVAFMAWSCEKEEFAYAAQYGKIYADKSPIYPGDTVTLYVEVNSAGNRIYRCDYSWRNNKGLRKTVSVIADDGTKTVKKKPQLIWVPTASGNYQFSMSATFKYSMADAQGKLGDSASARASNITVSARPD